jgi:zinc protease
MNNIFKKLLVVFTGSFVTVLSNGQAGADKPLPVSPEVKMGKLANGFTYYIRKNQEPKNRAELRLVVNAGSILENEKQLGLAHFTEHMAFNGTKNFKKQELVDFLEKSGVQFGADLNAYTSFDETVYELQLPTDSTDVFKKGFQILEDWAHNVSFEPAEIDKERGVVIEEWRLGQGAEERMRKKYFPVILKGSMYANRLPIGTKTNLETFKHQTLKDFYKTWYRPDLQAVVVVGDVDVDEVEQLIKQHFSGIPKAVNPQPRKKFGVPAHAETYTTIVTDPEQPYNVVQIQYLQPSIPQDKTDLQYRASIVRQIFNTMMSARLQEIGQKPDAPFLFASTGYDDYYGDKDAFSMYAVAKDGKTLAASSQVLLNENARVKQYGFTAGELERAKTDMLSGMETQYNERDKTKSAVLVGELIRNYLKQEPIPGIEYEYDLFKKYVPGIELKEVNSLINQWIKPTNRVVMITAPESEKKNLVTQQQMTALLNKPTPKLSPYEDKVTTGNLLAKEPVPGKITGEKKVEGLGVTELTLSNGARVILKPTTFKNNEIIFSAISPGGTSLYSDADYLSAATATTITVNGGVGNYDQLSFQKSMAGKQVFVSPSVSAYAEGFNGYAVPKDFETALQLVYGYFTEPRRDSSMFEVYLQQLSADLVNKGKDPNSVFSDSVSSIMSNYHPRSRPLTLERMKEIKFDKALDIYKERFSNAGDFLFTFVGNFNVDSIKALLEKYIASLPSTGRVESWKDVGIRYPQGIISKVIKKGQEKKSSVRITFTGTTEYNGLEAAQLNQLCQVFSIKLRELLREDQGGVYGVSVRGGINREPITTYAVSMSFGCAPENVEKLTSIVMEEIKNLKANGAPETNIQKIVAEGTRGMETSVKENNYWLYNLQTKYYRNEDPTTILDEAKMINKLTVERTKELANKYFNEANLAKFILMPEN